jgi:ferredoxin
MIVAEQKKLQELKNLIGSAENVLVVGCGTCVTVCFAGGAREAAIVSASLRMTPAGWE